MCWVVLTADSTFLKILAVYKPVLELKAFRAACAGTPIPAASVMDAANLMAFCAHEFEAFFHHIGGAIKQYQTTGQLPESLFKGSLPSHSTTGHQRTKTQRKPTAFNQFVKDKLQEFKATGFKLDDDKNGNLLFSLAVSEWKKLDEEAKQEYTRRFKASTQSASLGCRQLFYP